VEGLPGNISHAFDEPETPGRRSDEPLDLGSIELIDDPRDP
jgi:hypothetical protein